jgi:transcriptional regulator with XRE-family HTH domain
MRQVRRHTSGSAARSLAEDVERQVIDRLRAVRTARRLSQRALAEAMVARGFDGWSQATVSNCEAGVRPLRLGELAGLADALEVPLPRLLDDVTEDADRAAALVAVTETGARLSEALAQHEAARARAEAARAEAEVAERELAVAERERALAAAAAELARLRLDHTRTAATREG